MKVTIHEVNFGESILYQKGDKKLLVDCGAKFGQKGKLAYSRIENKIDTNTKLLITHFDEDHFNGVCEIPDGYKFEKIYLPLYMYRGNGVIRTEEMFVDTLKVWVYSVALGKKKKISALHTLFMKMPNLVRCMDNIKCVGYGDIIQLDDCNIQVLWPETNSRIKRKLYADEILEIIKRNFNNEDYDNSNYNLERFLRIADDYVEKFLEIYRVYCRRSLDDYGQDVNDNYINAQISMLDNIFKDMINSSLLVNISEEEKIRLGNIESIKIRNMNECSIVFTCEEDLIAFGDITPRIITHLNRKHNISKKKYKLVKTPHHGTKSYWTNKLPDAQAYLISNSGPYRIDWSIYEKYGVDYKDKIICIGDGHIRCVYHSLFGGCKICGASLVKTEITVDVTSL